MVIPNLIFDFSSRSHSFMNNSRPRRLILKFYDKKDMKIFLVNFFALSLSLFLFLFLFVQSVFSSRPGSTEHNTTQRILISFSRKKLFFCVTEKKSFFLILQELSLKNIYMYMFLLNFCINFFFFFRRSHRVIWEKINFLNLSFTQAVDRKVHQIFRIIRRDLTGLAVYHLAGGWLEPFFSLNSCGSLSMLFQCLNVLI
jgi:hypothetical protein